MQSSQLVKKRLQDLKKLSQNLKQTTQISADVDVSMIKAILQITRNIHKQPIQSLNNSYNNNNNMNMNMNNVSMTSSSSPTRQRMQNNGSSFFNNNNNDNSNVGSSSPNLHKIKSTASIASKYISPKPTTLTNNIYQQQHQNEHQQQQNIQPLFPQSRNNINNNMSKSIKNINTQSNSKLTLSNPNLNASNINNNNNNNNNNDQQLIHLQQQNNRLTIQLNNTKSMLNKYKTQLQNYQEQQLTISKKNNINNNNSKKSQFKDDNQNNNSPYFQLTQSVLLFATKLNILEADYCKIQYQRKVVRLTLDKIIVNFNNKASSQYKSTSTSIIPSSTASQQYNISDLIQIKYLSSQSTSSTSLMMLSFQSQSSSQLHIQSQKQQIYLYLQFDDHQTMHRWDLALFINYKIVDCLGKEKIFQQENVFHNNNNNKFGEISNNQDNDDKDQNQNDDKKVLQKYLQNKQKYIESQRKLKQTLLSQISQKRNKQKSQKSSQNILYKQKQQKQKIENNTNIKKQQKPEFILKSPPILSKLSDNSLINNSNEFNRNNKQVEKHKQLKNMQQINQQQMQRDKQKQQKEDQQKKFQAQRKQKIENAISLVKKGMFMTKYAKSAYKPHQKRVFVSEDNTKLCWEDKQNSKQAPKYVLISQIQSINKGELGPGVLQHLDQKKIKNVNCFMLITLNCKDRKTLEFSMKSLKLMEEFIQALIVFLGQYKQGKLPLPASTSPSKLSPNKR